MQGLQQNYAAFADNFPICSEHSTAFAPFSVWTVLAEIGMGASLQHYNPIVDAQVDAIWNILETWQLCTQLVFASIENTAGDKAFVNDAERCKVFK